MPRLVIVSNRVALPDRTGKQVAGGLAVALHEAFKGYQGLWFGWSGKVAAQATRIQCFPIGIDASEFQQIAARSHVNRLVRQTSAGLGSRKFIIGVDRLDYSTNIEPGLTDTDFMLVRFGGDAEKKERFNQGVTPMTAEDIAEAIFWSCTLPRNVNINRIQMMPITQAFSPFARSGGPTPVH